MAFSAAEDIKLDGKFRKLSKRGNSAETCGSSSDCPEKKGLFLPFWFTFFSKYNN